jgi:hypothetical protein
MSIIFKWSKNVMSGLRLGLKLGLGFELESLVIYRNGFNVSSSLKSTSTLSSI